MTAKTKTLKNLFRYRKVGDRWVVTNDHGRFALMDDAGLTALVNSKIKPGSPLWDEMNTKGFLFTEDELPRIAADYDRKMAYLYRGPVLHIMVVTLRCNQVCVYCHASRAGMKATETDMSIPTAERVVDMAMTSPSDTIVLEFQGGEPLANWEVVKHVVEYGSRKADETGKRVMFSLVSNLSLMDDDKLAYLVKNRVQISTSLDGPKDLHDSNRHLAGSSSYDKTVYWMQRINQAYIDGDLDPKLYHVEALATITKAHLARGRELVDEYVKQGCRAIFLRPLNPFGFAKTTQEKIAYAGSDFLDFYDDTLDYILDLNKQGVEILERLSAIFLTKILTPDDPNYLDIRSPCGAGIGQIAYNHDGTIFTCDEGRMVYQMGDDVFKIGQVDRMTLREVVTHDTVKTMAVASTLDSLPGCSTCAYKPYCGTCPVYNYTEQGNIFPQNSTNHRCKIYMGVQDRLFKYFVNNNESAMSTFERWVEVKDRPEYMHDRRRLNETL